MHVNVTTSVINYLHRLDIARSALTKTAIRTRRSAGERMCARKSIYSLALSKAYEFITPYGGQYNEGSNVLTMGAMRSISEDEPVWNNAMTNANNSNNQRKQCDIVL